MGQSLICCKNALNLKAYNDIEKNNNGFTFKDPISVVNPDILLREDIILISKFGSLQMITKKLKKKLKKFLNDGQINNMIEKNSTTKDSHDIKVKTKYQMLAEQLIFSLKYKKKLINEQILKLSNAFGKTYLEEDCLFDATKYFKKIDESLDKVSEDIYEMERSYPIECPGIVVPKSCSKITNQISHNFGNESQEGIISPNIIKRTSSENNISQMLGMNLYKDTVRNSKEYEIRSIKTNPKFTKPNDQEKYYPRCNYKIESPQEFSKFMDYSQSKSLSKKSRTTKGSSQHALSQNDKHSFNFFRSKSVYKEEASELTKKVGRIFEKYNVSESLVNRRVKKMYMSKTNNRRIESQSSMKSQSKNNCTIIEQQKGEESIQDSIKKTKS